MKRAICVVTGLVLSACGGGRVVDFKDGVPSKEAVTLSAPGASNAMEGLGQSRSALEGETADLYRLTAGATLLVNGFTAGVLVNLAAVVTREPTSVEGDVAVFGPHTPSLSPTTWRLSVTRTGPNAFSYVLEAKPKDRADDAYRTALSGSHVVAYDSLGNPRPGYGHGTFLIEWSNAYDVGSAEFSYAHEARTAQLTVDVVANNQHVGAAPWNAQYAYVLNPGAGGRFQFATDLNIDWDPAKSAMERWSIESRWQENGAGRSDALLTGGDLTSSATANECWDDMFQSTYLFHSYDAVGWGTEGTCAFAAEYSSL